MAGTKTTIIFRTSFFMKTKGNTGKLRANARMAAKQLANDGRAYARSIAPYDTGRMARLITVEPLKIKGKNSFGYEVISKNPVKGGGTTYRSGGETRSTNPKFNTKGIFDLVKWAHKSKFAAGHFSGGNPRYMFKAKGYMMKLRNTLIKSNVIKKGIVK